MKLSELCMSRSYHHGFQMIIHPSQFLNLGLAAAGFDSATLHSSKADTVSQLRLEVPYLLIFNIYLLIIVASLWA